MAKKKDFELTALIHQTLEGPVVVWCSKLLGQHASPIRVAKPYRFISTAKPLINMPLYSVLSAYLLLIF